MWQDLTLLCKQSSKAVLQTKLTSRVERDPRLQRIVLSHSLGGYFFSQFEAQERYIRAGGRLLTSLHWNRPTEWQTEVSALNPLVLLNASVFRSCNHRNDQQIIYTLATKRFSCPLHRTLTRSVQHNKLNLFDIVLSYVSSFPGSGTRPSKKKRGGVSSNGTSCHLHSFIN